jgi:hypothetical protein
MIRKILAGGLIFLSSVLLIFSLVGIGAAWIWNETLTRKSITQIQGIDSQLAQIQSDIQNAKAEVERALRIVDSAEKALSSLVGQTSGAKDLLQQVNSLLDDKLIPGLQTTQTKIDQVRTTLEDLRNSLKQINTLPFLDLNIPGDEFLASLLVDADGLNSEIVSVQDLAQRASTFVSDTSYLLGGDFTDTKQDLEDLNLVLKDYDDQIRGWRSQADRVIKSLPRWIDLGSVILTFCLLWFGLSQFGLLMHGLSLWKGRNPLVDVFGRR